MPTTTLLRRGIVAIVLLSPLAILSMADDAPNAATRAEARTEKRDSKEPPSYNVCAYLRVRATQLSFASGGESKLDLAEFDFYKRNLAVMIKTPPVIKKALSENGIADLSMVKQHSANAVEWLTQQIKVRFPGDAEVMTVCMTGEDRDQSRKIVDAVAAALQSEIIDADRTAHLVRRDTLDKKIRANKQSELDRRGQLYDLSQQIGTADAETAKLHHQAAIEELNELNKNRRERQRMISDLSLQIELAKRLANPKEKSGDSADRIKRMEVERELLLAQTDEASKAVEVQRENIQKLERFNGDVDQLRSDIEQTRKLTTDMAAIVNRLNLELDAPPRVSVISPAE